MISACGEGFHSGDIVSNQKISKAITADLSRYKIGQWVKLIYIYKIMITKRESTSKEIFLEDQESRS